MADYVGTTEADTFIGSSDVNNKFFFNRATLSSSDIISGGTGTRIDSLTLNGGGNFTRSDFSGITGIDNIVLESGAYTINITNQMAQTAKSGVITIQGSDFAERLDHLVRATAVTDPTTSVNYVVSTSGSATFIGGESKNTVIGGNIDADDIFVGGGGTAIDTFRFSFSSGLKDSDHLENVLGFEVIILASYANSRGTITQETAGSANGGLTAIGGDYTDVITVTASTAITLRLGNGENTYTGRAGNHYVSGGKDRDVFNGGDGNERLIGFAGSDEINGGGGSDNIDAGADADIIVGGSGADVILGGTGADVFRYNATSDSTNAQRDWIRDFSRAQGDLIDLRSIDANAGAADDQAFVFVGTAGFTRQAGELRAITSSGNTFVYGDVDGDAVADLVIRVNPTTFQADDFLL